MPDLLTAQEERTLLAAAQAGDQSARDELVERNLKLVKSISCKFKSDCLDADDLYMEGCIGLIRAIEKWNPNRGTRFSTYATHWIKQAIRRGIEQQSRMIRLPAHVWERVRGTELAPEQQAPLSLDQPSGRGNRDSSADMDTLADVLKGGFDPADEYEPHVWEDQMTALRRALPLLPTRDQQLIDWYYGLSGETPKPFSQIAPRLGITRQGVEQRLKRALWQLRKVTNEPTDRDPRPDDD
jgi:RNA polymerase primary sigma factor